MLVCVCVRPSRIYGESWSTVTPIAAPYACFICWEEKRAFLCHLIRLWATHVPVIFTHLYKIVHPNTIKCSLLGNCEDKTGRKSSIKKERTLQRGVDDRLLIEVPWHSDNSWRTQDQLNTSVSS